MAVATPACLCLDPSFAAQLAQAAEAAYPEECCGLIVGRRLGLPPEQGEGARLVVTRLVPAANLHREPRRAFELDPAAHFAVLRQLRQRHDQAREGGQPPEELLGHYHSHPDGPAAPSARDAAAAHDPELTWLIVGLAQGRCQDITAWWVVAASPNGAVFQPLLVTPPPTPRDTAKNP
jgi:proteasome lid subunit RPN8/RPN11